MFYITLSDKARISYIFICHGPWKQINQ